MGWLICLPPIHHVATPIHHHTLRPGVNIIGITTTNINVLILHIYTVDKWNSQHFQLRAQTEGLFCDESLEVTFFSWNTQHSRWTHDKRFCFTSFWTSIRGSSATSLGLRCRLKYLIHNIIRLLTILVYLHTCLLLWILCRCRPRCSCWSRCRPRCRCWSGCWPYWSSLLWILCRCRPRCSCLICWSRCRCWSNWSRCWPRCRCWSNWSRCWPRCRCWSNWSRCRPRCCWSKSCHNPCHIHV